MENISKAILLFQGKGREITKSNISFPEQFEVYQNPLRAQNKQMKYFVFIVWDSLSSWTVNTCVNVVERRHIQFIPEIQVCIIWI